MKELEELKEKTEEYNKDADEETRKDNEAFIASLEQDYIRIHEREEWEGLAVTQKLVEHLRKHYVELSVLLAEDRTLTVDDRMVAFAKKEAVEWLIREIKTDAGEDMKTLKHAVLGALSRI